MIETATETAVIIGRTLKATICLISKTHGPEFTWVTPIREKQPLLISISRKHKRPSSWNGLVYSTIILADFHSSLVVFQINIIQLQDTTLILEFIGEMVHISTIYKMLKVTSPQQQLILKLMDF